MEFFGEDVCDVANLDIRRLLVEAAANLHHAGRAGNGNRVGTCILDVLDFLLEHRQRDFAVLDTEGASHAAALVRVLHLDEVDIRDAVEQRARLLVDAEAAAHVARIMIRDLVRAGCCLLLEAASLFISIGDKARELVNLLGKRISAGAPLWVVLEELVIRMRKRLGAGRACRQDDINACVLKCLDVLLCNLLARFAVAHPMTGLPQQLCSIGYVKA